MFPTIHGVVSQGGAGGSSPPAAVLGGRALYGETAYGSSSVNWEMGWAFTVGANDIHVGSLMIHAPVPATETVKIYRASDQTVVATASVSASGGWGETEITPVTLAAGTQYVIARTSGGSSRAVSTLMGRTVDGVNRSQPADPAIGSVAGRANTGGDGYPTTNVGNIAAVNFRTLAPASGYRFYRLNVTAANGGGRLRISELQLRESVGGADATGSGTATESRTAGSSFTATALYDGSTGTFWWTPSGVEVAWTAYDFGTAAEKTIVEYVVQAASAPTEAPNAWTLEGSHDFENWDVLDTVTGEAGWSSGEARTYTV